jgi:hypothetical protein
MRLLIYFIVISILLGCAGKNRTSVEPKLKSKVMNLYFSSDSKVQNQVNHLIEYALLNNKNNTLQPSDVKDIDLSNISIGDNYIYCESRNLQPEPDVRAYKYQSKEGEWYYFILNSELSNVRDWYYEFYRFRTNILTTEYAYWHSRDRFGEASDNCRFQLGEGQCRTGKFQFFENGIWTTAFEKNKRIRNIQKRIYDKDGILILQIMMGSMSPNKFSYKLRVKRGEECRNLEFM